MSEKLMVAYRIEFIDGTAKSGTCAVPSTDPAAACRAVAGLIRAKYPHEAEDVSVTCIGPA